jgi:hypothetical protein
MTRALLTLTALLLAAPAAAQMRADSTVSAQWRLGNGLEVRMRHVPGAAAVAVVLGARHGRAHEPAGREGLAEMLTTLVLTAPAGEVPARSLDAMPELRPLGWGLQVTPQTSACTEIVRTDQVPGVLRELALRLRGVTVTPETMRGVLLRMRRDYGERHFARPELAAHYRLREVGEGVTDEDIVRRASLTQLERLRGDEVQQLLARHWCPANAVLSLAGDLEALDLRAMIEAEFGPLPAGTAQPEARQPALQASQRVTRLQGLAQEAGAVGLFAPALEDSLHPSYYLAMVVFGAWANDHWGKPVAPFRSRFQYSLFDEPDLVRLYPPVGAGTREVQPLLDEFNLRADLFAQTMTPMAILDQARGVTGWLIGGDLPGMLLRHARRDPGTLGTLAGTAAHRALWRGDAFWAEYRRRFETSPLAPGYFYSALVDPRRQIGVLFTPATR